MTSVNNKIILRPYVNTEGLKKEIRNGFAMVQQKSTIKGLKVLMDSRTEKCGLVEKGMIAYLSEELLCTQPWAKKVMSSDAVDGPFIIVDIGFIDFIGKAEDENSVPGRPPL